ncbi:putative disease resistance protein RGA3 [Actinidia eriantha]|uniref:putative disease resistance protein RGA3 n=1 Tax=Actinidia eriantha TaxID=165200 RepID=UPI002589D8D5|nr:putative disease resistance protein RGA3 [Actinidia eriantha]
MLETFMFNIADMILQKLGRLVLDELVLAKGVQSELQKLDNSLSTIKAVLLDAEEQQTHNRELREWLGKLKHAFNDADDLLDEFEIEALQNQLVNHGMLKTVRSFLPTPHSLIFRFSIGHKLKEIRERFDEIAALRAKFHLTDRFVDRRAAQREREMTHSFVRSVDVIGRKREKEEIAKMLMYSSYNSENVSVIPIVGIGGLGKTTVAKLVYNDDKVDNHFELKMWVCVSEDFDVKVLMRKIIESATRSTCGDPEIDLLQSQLRGCLVSRKFLLILDDVWNSDHGKWVGLKSLLMVGARGSKIVITTRSKIVASVMGTTKGYNLDGLALNDCLSLFVKWAFPMGEERKHPNLLKIGKEIVKKCNGVPLAARTLGSILFKKTDEQAWLLVRNSEIWELQNQTQDDILPALRLSYDQLPPYLKQCFGYCSIFPKAQYVDKDKLIQLWMAQGLVQTSVQNQELEDVASQYFDELCSTSLFQEVQENGPLYVTFRMHDLVHDLAQSVAQTECIMKKFHNKDISIMVRHVSFWGCDYLSGKEVPRSICKLEKLRTIVFPRDGIRSIRDSFIDDCISKFLYLRVIDLADSCFEVLPKSIRYLKHLRYLELSRNHSIKKLPNSICKLLSLQTLRISDCKELKQLPRDIRNLICLRHLYVTTLQKCFPEKSIGCLTSLRSLWINSCVNLASLPEDIQNLTALRTLAINTCPKLTSLPGSIANLTALESLMINDCEELEFSEGKGIQDLSIRRLVIGGLLKLVALPQWFHGAARSIHYLRISYCPNFGQLPEWLNNSTSLQKLEILECPKLSELPKGFHHLNALKVLRIADCDMLIRRYRPTTGKDWKMIAHIPDIYLNKAKISTSHY